MHDKKPPPARAGVFLRVGPAPILEYSWASEPWSPSAPPQAGKLARAPAFDMEGELADPAASRTPRAPFHFPLSSALREFSANSASKIDPPRAESASAFLRFLLAEP